MALGGTLRADAVRVDAPQYGMHFTDGRLTAHLRDGNVVVDELVLTAGAGQFRASGTVTSATTVDAATAARIGWHASNFRLFNRPDLRLVVDGDGTLAVVKGKLALAGTLKAVEGRIVYVSDPEATLGDDVVVKGWPRQSSSAFRASDLPLVVDLALDFGDRLTFASEGLDTGLSGTVRVTTGPRGLIGRGSITRRERHLSRVRPEARHRPRASHLRRPARQSRARHHRPAQEPRGRSRRRA